MRISYKLLWRMLVERDMRKEDLRLAAGLTANMITNMGKAKTSAWKRWLVSVKP
ncbi:Cro/Cl family transcriptional regulator [Bifidobacterium eulemuris]|uniref:Cro/Cl family transcriptional regulator n=1 Tax=Bifidobacterium eulemuris TaxID=1765219 RepID=A0A261GDA9_9BIFI|nr:Cro/Cl family transcriptional regulator [Bifidobacterium eulemuris]